MADSNNCSSLLHSNDLSRERLTYTTNRNKPMNRTAFRFVGNTDCKPNAISKQKPIVGMYNERSAKTKPTVTM